MVICVSNFRARIHPIQCGMKESGTSSGGGLNNTYLGFCNTIIHHVCLGILGFEAHLKKPG